MKYQVVKLDERPSIGSILLRDPELPAEFVVIMEREPYFLLEQKHEGDLLKEGETLFKVGSIVVSEDYFPDVDDVFSESNVEFTIEEVL